ncbi:MAG: thiolase family protein [Gammaproteobacteria bacterium]|nr:thiolase family protein [Gammaproteobacteria bacterium]MCP5200127.1 thiolase family protein [Gammaproteobacteria bacterium]
MNGPAEIPYGAWWSTPFCKWQTDFQHLHALKFAAHVAQDALAQRGIPGEVFDFAVLGSTIPQPHCFYGAPWLMSLAGMGGIAGPSVAQACATGVRAIAAAAGELALGLATTALVVTADRTSNGAHLYYPEPAGMGGTGSSENWVLDNFSCDPNGGHAMITTAENVAAKHAIPTELQHEVVLRRYAQYQDALADDRAFQKRYMRLPFEVPRPRFDKTATIIAGDVGVTPTSGEALARLRPVLPDGTVTFAAQTHPADGNAGLVVTTPARAAELSIDANVRVRLLGFGQARVAPAYMPEAVVPAASVALAQAGLAIADIEAVKTHNPFAVNDIVFARATGFPWERMNNYGCSLIWGHPQAPTGTRAIIELIEELALRGGGRGLFSGCAAGDTAMALVVGVEVA